MAGQALQVWCVLFMQYYKTVNFWSSKAMAYTQVSPSSCCCNEAEAPCKSNNDTNNAPKSVYVAPSVVLSFFIAFFPKCPACWATYMSMFGSIGLAELPYMEWLFPVLGCFFGLHLWLLFQKTSQKGYGPLVITLIGTSLILAGRNIFTETQWILFVGMFCVLVGSLWNNFSSSSFKTSIS